MAAVKVNKVRMAPNHTAAILNQITPVQRLDTNRAEEVARNLEHLIAACALEAGDWLGTKEDLRRRFQVSPGTMNEAVRILESRGVIETRRGLKGGIFASSVAVEVALKQVARAVELNAAVGEYCWAVSMQLEPLVVAEATRSARVDSVAELNSLLGRMAAAVDDPTELLRCCGFLYRRIAEMGGNPLLTAIYTALLELLEQSNGLLQHAIPGQLVVKCRRVVKAIASGDAQHAAAVAAHERLNYPESLSAIKPLQTLSQTRKI